MLARVRTYLFASLTPITMLLAVVASICLFSAPALDSELAQVRVGAFEAGSWNGIVMVVDDLTSFQVRVGTQAEFGDYLDGDNGPDFFQESFRKSIGGRRPGQWAILYRTAPLTDGIKEVGRTCS